MRRVFRSENSFGLLVTEFLFQDPWGYWSQFHVLYFPSKPFPSLLHSEILPSLTHYPHRERIFPPLQCKVRIILFLQLFICIPQEIRISTSVQQAFTGLSPRASTWPELRLHQCRSSCYELRLSPR